MLIALYDCTAHAICSYDPWDVEIDLDPYPTYRRLRDEMPLYYNERHDFWGISRYEAFAADERVTAAPPRRPHRT